MQLGFKWCFELCLCLPASPGPEQGHEASGRHSPEHVGEHGPPAPVWGQCCADPVPAPQPRCVLHPELGTGQSLVTGMFGCEGTEAGAKLSSAAVPVSRGLGAPAVSSYLPWMLWNEPWQLLSEQHLVLPPSFHPVQPFSSRHWRAEVWGAGGGSAPCPGTRRAGEAGAH